MQVNPSGAYPQPASVSEPTVRSAAPSGAAVATAAPNPADTGAFMPTGDLAKLLAAIKLTPEVRTDVINSVADRMASGEFMTPEAAGDAARAMLDPNKGAG